MKEEMARLERELEALSKDHDELDRQLTACQSLLTLPRRLPEDILREIFQLGLPTDRNAYPSKKTAPLIFTHICRRWRRVAISTPSLWSTIHIRITQKRLEMNDP